VGHAHAKVITDGTEIAKLEALLDGAKDGGEFIVIRAEEEEVVDVDGDERGGTTVEARVASRGNEAEGAEEGREGVKPILGRSAEPIECTAELADEAAVSGMANRLPHVYYAVDGTV
jgi:hypothetical protein